MRRLKRLLYITMAAVLMLSVCAMPASAELKANTSSTVPYDTYVYDYAGNPVITPHAYIPAGVLDIAELGLGNMTTPSDLEVDEHNNIYLVDTGYAVSSEDMDAYIAGLPGAAAQQTTEEEVVEGEVVEIVESEDAAEETSTDVEETTEPTAEDIAFYEAALEASYSADPGSYVGRLIILNPDFTVKVVISTFYNTETKTIDGFDNPQGVTIANGFIYVADTNHRRILQFNMDGSFAHEFAEPEIAYSDDATPYTPLKVAVDGNGNMFVVSNSEVMGIILLNNKGEFAGYVGAQQVTYSVVDYIWKNILSQEQQDRMKSFVPTEYSNVKIDEYGFLYATTDKIDADEVSSSVLSGKADSKSSPIKRLNPTGNDVLVRKGYFNTVGDVSFRIDPITGPDISIIRDVALGPNGRYTLLDDNYNRLFTYSSDGELIYAFSGIGFQTGNSQTPVSIAYDTNYDLYLLDQNTGYVTVFALTEYGRLIDEAYQYYKKYDYKNSVKKWDEVLSQNANFDIAYDGKGNTYMQDENYGAAMDMFRYSNNKERYSDALSQHRASLVENYLLVIVAVAVVLIYLLAKGFGWINKRNSPKCADKHGTFLNKILYAFYIMIHPFDGFWDVKHEKRGNAKAATVIAGGLILARVISKFFTNYLFNSSYGTEISVMSEVLIVVMPLGLWTLCNWCVTTLADGEGSIRDVYIFTCYALLPMALFTILNTVISHFIVLDEAMYMTFFGSLGVIWSGFLIFSGNTQTHRYTVSKSVLSILMAGVGMAIVVFVALVIFTTYQQIYNFIDNIVKEITYRM